LEEGSDQFKAGHGNVIGFFHAARLRFASRAATPLSARARRCFAVIFRATARPPMA